MTGALNSLLKLPVHALRLYDGRPRPSKSGIDHYAIDGQGCPSYNSAQHQQALKTGRGGFTMLEIIVTVIIFGMVLAIVGSLTRRILDQRRLLEARRAAVLEVASALETLEADPTVRPEPGQKKTLEMPTDVAGAFDSPRLVASAAALPDESGGIRIDVAMSWMTKQNRRSAPISLSTVVFPAESPVPAQHPEGGAP